jgi:hypothetical protein
VRNLPAKSTITISIDPKLVLSNHFIHTISLASPTTPLAPYAGSSVTLTATNSNAKLVITGFDNIPSSTNILITIGV